MRSTDVAVVGGGPAGIAAALAAAGSGARTVLVDEGPTAGGRLRWRVAEIAGLEGDLADQPGVQLAATLSAQLAPAGVDITSGSVAWGLFEENVLGVANGDASYQLQAPSVIIASGATDRVAPFPGSTLPGVMTATAVQIFLHVQRVYPGKRFAVIGAGPEADEVASDITLAGAEVVCRVPGVEGAHVSGLGGVEAITIDDTKYEIDAVVVALGRQPDPELACQAQVEIGYSEMAGGQVPLRDATLQTTVPGLFVVGNAAGLVSVAEGMAEGQLAGLHAAGASDSEIDEAASRLQAMRSDERRAVVEQLRIGA